MSAPWHPSERERAMKLAHIARCNLTDLQAYEGEAKRRTCEPRWIDGEQAAIAARYKELGK